MSSSNFQSPVVPTSKFVDAVVAVTPPAGGRGGTYVGLKSKFSNLLEAELKARLRRLDRRRS